MVRLEALATWTESLRDTIAGAVGLEQAIPSSLRVAAPSLQEPLARLVDRLHTRVPMPEALHRLADDLDDPSADLIIGALIINARLRGPGLRDLLGALSTAVREELDVRRKVNAERRSTRRSAQIVVLVSVGLALGLAVLNPGYVHVYDSLLGQLVLVIVVALYAAGFVWMRRLATFDAPERLLAGPSPAPPGSALPGSALPGSALPGSAGTGGSATAARRGGAS
jgi:Flp pilus assembly protein TadB